MLEACRGVLPVRFKHGYAHFHGAMIEEFFFKCATCDRLSCQNSFFDSGGV